MDYAPSFVDLEHYEEGDKDVELAEMLLDLKENVEMRRRVEKDVLDYLSTKDSFLKKIIRKGKNHFFSYHMDGGICIFFCYGCHE